MNNTIIQNISQKIKDWNKKMKHSNNFVKIHREYINTPEG